jgi:hypothetical protein
LSLVEVGQTPVAIDIVGILQVAPKQVNKKVTPIALVYV